MAKIDSIYDVSDKALVELKSWLQPWFIDIDLPGGTAPLPPFFDSAITLGATHNLLGYWRLGDGASPFADSNPYMTAFPLTKTAGTNAMNVNLTPGALPPDQDDGAVAFTATGGVSGGTPVSDYLKGHTDNRFNLSAVSATFALWVNPTASGSTFTGGVGGTRTGDVSAGVWDGWGMTMDWPTRVINWHHASLTLVGPALPAAAWTFVVGTFSAAAGNKLYLNGALVAADGAAGPGGVNPPNDGFWLGGLRDHPGNVNSFYGGLDEASVWGNELSSGDIALLYESGGTAITTGLSVVRTTGAYTATAADSVILANGTYTVSLPTAVGTSGKQYTVKNTGSGTITVDPAGSETIDGSGTVSLAANKAVTVVSEGVNWVAIGGY